MSKIKQTLAALARSTCFSCVAVISVSAQGQPAGIETEAVEKLENSMSYVAGLGRFALETSSSIEVVLHSGQKIQLDSTVDLTVQRPNKLHAIRKGEIGEQEFFYDGESLTLHDGATNYHATVDAPATLDGMLDFARDSLDVTAPASEFIYSNNFEVLMEEVKSGFVVGTSFIDGTACDHLAFSAPGTDWQIWIQQGDKPLPRRLVITSRDVLNAPQYTVRIHDWNLTPDLSKQEFSYTGQENSIAIDFARFDVTPEQETDQE